MKTFGDRWLYGLLIGVATCFAVGLVTTALPTAAMAQEEAAEKPAAEPASEAAETPAEEAAEVEEAADPLAAYIAENDYALNTLIMFICAVLVLFMQAGFAMVEIGLNSAKNAVNILAKNVMDLSVGVILYLFIGFNLMYPGDSWMSTGDCCHP
jgi:Ammonia permease